MKITGVNTYRFQLPFVVAFSHSRRKGAAADNVIVEVVTDEDIRGYGEGAPRPYVTGETQDTVLKTVPRLIEIDSFPWHLENVEQIWRFVDSVPLRKELNSALCALETALLDVLGKFLEKPVIEFFDKSYFTNQIYYGSTIPLASTDLILMVCERTRRLGISKIRLKMGKDYDQNHQALKTVRSFFGDDGDFRVDVNGAWDLDLAMAHTGMMRQYDVRVLEQPMMPGDKNLAVLAEELQPDNIVLMADESCCTLGDMNAIIENGWYGMVNVRLSKCGGFRKSLQIVEAVREHGLTFQVGCQLGESGILSAAGRSLGLLCGDATYWDGSYDAFLLKENVTHSHVTFARNGAAGPLDGFGLGVKVDVEKLRLMIRDSRPVSVKKS